MKTKTLLFALTIFFSTNLKNLCNAQPVNTEDSLALVDFYNSTNGNNWKVHTNWLAGAVSTWYGVTVINQRVINLFLSNNNLSGTILPSIGDLDSLREFNLSTNKIHGNIPATIANLSALVSLDWSSNQLKGSVPFTIIKLRKLLHFDVSYNLLTDGKNNDFYLPNVRYFFFDLINNRFTFSLLESVAKTLPDCYYAPQQKILIHQHGDTLAVSAGGTLGNNTYNWFQAGKSGYTTIVADSVFVPSESGTYYVKVTNSVATKLTLNSEAFIYNKVSAKHEPLSKRISVSMQKEE